MLLNNPFITANTVKTDLKLNSTRRTVANAIHKLGWRQVPTKYCQIVEPINRVKRFIYANCCKVFGEKFNNVINVDETTIEQRLCSPMNYRKPGCPSLRPHGGKLPKPKHNNKIHLFGGISRKGLTPLVMFKGIKTSRL